MSFHVDTATRTFTASGALGQFLRVRLNGSFELALCSDTDLDCLGVMEQAAFLQGDKRAVILLNKQGTIPMIANAAIAEGAEVFAAAAGKVAPAGTVSMGENLEAATTDDDQIEVFPRPQFAVST